MKWANSITKTAKTFLKRKKSMGGSYEKTVESQPKNKVVVPEQPEPWAGVDIPVQTLRIHENKGEIHFHDDKSSLKAAMPFAEYQVAMRGLKRMRPVSFVDDVNKTLLTISPMIDGKSLSLYMRLVPVQFGDNFTALNDIYNKK